MAIDNDLNTRELQKFVESISVPGLPVVAIANPDGTSIGSITAGGDGSIVDGVSSSIKASVLDYTNSNPLAVRLTDTAGDYVAAGAGTQYTEDAAAAANPVGGTLMLVREDARAGGLTTTDGDNVAARGNNKGELYVKTTDSDALLTTIDADTGNISTKIDTIAGAVSGTEVQVDVLTSALPTGASTLAEQQSQTTHLSTIAGDTTSIQTAVELIDDTVATLGTTTYTEAATKGLTIGAVRRDADTSLVNTTNEIAPLIVDARGFLKTEVFSGETLPISGTVDLGATDNAVLDAIAASVAAIDTDATTIIGHVDGLEGLLTTIDADTGSIATTNTTIAGAVSGTEMQVDVITMPTTTVQATNLDIRDLTSSDVVTANLSATDNAVLDNIDTATSRIGVAQTSGGWTPFKSIDLDETEEEIKATAGQVGPIYATNTTTAPLYLKFYNATAANVTVGTTVPVLTMPVPANADSDVGGFTLVTDLGWEFTTAITVACTTGVADNDTGAPGANACIVNIGYQ